MSRTSRILIIDDNADARQIMQTALADGDFDLIEEAGSAEDAHQRLGLTDNGTPPAFDCILIDIMMLGIDGIEACAAIRFSRRYRDVPIIVLTQQNEVKVLNQAFMAGANDYVSKPIVQIELLARVRSALRFKRETDRRQDREAQLRTKQDATGESGFDTRTGLANRLMLESRLNQAIADDEVTTVLILQVNALAEYRQEHGADAVKDLTTRLAVELATLQAPLGTLFGLFADDIFMAIGGENSYPMLTRLGKHAENHVFALSIPHGSSAVDDYIRLHPVVSQAYGDELLQLPGRLIMDAERLSSREYTGVSRSGDYL